jgi:H+/Cl- antiporter ClcA
MRIRKRASKLALLLLATALAASIVSLVYFYFEAAVRHSTNYIWNTLLNTGTKRLLLVPACLVLGVVFFGIQHYVDQKNEQQETEGLGQMPAPTIPNFFKVIGIGFLSLIAGATLGPEAVLLPASLIVGGFIGTLLLKKDPFAKIIGLVGFVAIIAAFFNSFWAGMLGLLLLKRQVSFKLTPGILILAALASAVTALTLSLLSSKPYVKLPATQWHLSLTSLLMMVLLLLAGFATTYVFALLHSVLAKIQQITWDRGWLIHGVVAGSGLAVLYLLGGTLVEFTGNESIIPMLHKAASLGIIGLLWIFVIKIAAISWCKALNYRGGMVFPTIFVASVLVAIAQQIDKSVSFTIGLLVVMAGVIIANQKRKILF